MLKFIDTILLQFQPYFKKISTFSWFVIIILGLMVRTNLRGVSSIIGGLGLDPCNYVNMLHFFRSAGYKLSNLIRCWSNIILENCNPVLINEKIILLGDHIKISKEAKYMPGVKKHHQDSENVGKSEHIFGHQYGMIGVLVEGSTNQCIPANIELHDGMNEIRDFENEDLNKPKSEENCIVKMIRMAGKFTKDTSQKAIFIIDAYFSTASSFDEVKKINADQGQEMVTLVTRAKSNTVAFEEPPARVEGQRGASRKYGNKIIFKNLFDNFLGTFQTKVMNLYGKDELVRYLCIDLIWRPIKRKVRFVLVKTGDKTMILMCSDLFMNPEDIILAYTYRFKIEVSFKMLKHIIGGFFYHFWTKAMPKISRYKTSTDFSKVKDKDEKKKIVKTIQAIEVFTFLSCVAMGILTMLSLKFPALIWRCFPGWLRTKTSETPSIETTGSVLKQLFFFNFCSLKKYKTLSLIHRYQKTDFWKEFEEDFEKGA